MDAEKFKTFCKNQGLELTKIYTGDSFLKDNTFWKTRYENILFTDYNLDENMGLKGVVFLFYKENGVFIRQPLSELILNNDYTFQNELDEFNDYVQRKLKEIETKQNQQ